MFWTGHYVSQPIKVIEIHLWAFTFSNVFGGVSHEEHGHLCLATVSPVSLLPIMHFPKCITYYTINFSFSHEVRLWALCHLYKWRALSTIRLHFSMHAENISSVNL